MGCHYKGARSSLVVAHDVVLGVRLGGIPLSALAVDGYCGT